MHGGAPPFLPSCLRRERWQKGFRGRKSGEVGGRRGNGRIAEKEREGRGSEGLEGVGGGSVGEAI